VSASSRRRRLARLVDRGIAVVGGGCHVGRRSAQILRLDDYHPAAVSHPSPNFTVFFIVVIAAVLVVSRVCVLSV